MKRISLSAAGKRGETKRVKNIIHLLHREYPRSSTALRYNDPFRLLVAVILSAQCTDRKVNEIAPALFRKYGGSAGFARAKRRILEREIRQSGFYRNKAKHIVAASRKIEDEFGGNVPRTMDELLSLPGVARKTANIILSSAFGKAEGIAVDTHVRRLAQRLGLSESKDPAKIERDLMNKVPRKDWLDFNYLLVDHGRKICAARRPACSRCILRGLCPSAGAKSSI